MSDEPMVTIPRYIYEALMATLDTESQRRLRENERHRERRARASFVDLTPATNPDNGAVKAPITEVHS